MALTDGTLNLLGTDLAGLTLYASLHTTSPGTAGSNESAAARIAVAFDVDADGDLTLPGPLAFTGGTPSGPCTYVGLWSASTGGTFRGSFLLTGDTTFNADGEYTVTSLSITTTSS